MQAVRRKRRQKRMETEETVKDEETSSCHARNETDIVVPVNDEMDDSIEDFTSLDEEISPDDIEQLSSHSTFSVIERNDLSPHLPIGIEETTSSQEEIGVKVETDDSSRDQVVDRDTEYRENDSNADSKHENDISVGYDIIADYSSSVEEAVVLNSPTNILEEAITTSDEILVKTKDCTMESGDEPSAPCDSVEALTYEYVPVVCYPDILSQIPYVMDTKEDHEKLKPFTEVEMSNLYYNAELRHHDSFVDDFIETELKSGRIVNHLLYQMLTSYSTCRDNRSKNEINFGTLFEDCKQFREQIWTLNTSSFTEYGECQDGNPVSATHSFTVAHFNSYIYENFSRCVRDLETLATESYILNIFNEILYRLKIEHYIDSVCHTFSFVLSQSQIQLFNESEPRGPYGTDLRSSIIELKDAISVLFRFQRRLMRDEQFTAETRQWLFKLVSVLLRIATPNDHLFLLHHILRCPAGVGKWASQFIQPPIPCRDTMNQFYIDHLITTLAAVLLPIRNRDMFLQQMEAAQEDCSAWVIVDSDGEDGEDGSNQPRTALKESDLIAFLNQIPFPDIFRQILRASYRNEDYTYDVNAIMDHDVLRSIAISTLMVNLFEKGIANYSSPVYRQFCKLLSRLIQHTACYISEHWQMFREAYIQRSIVDSDMLNRLQTEYDEFFLRVVNTLYTTHERIGWQYLATLPFGMMTSHTLWRLYQYLFHVNSDSGLLMSEEFIETLLHLPDNDTYYFLTTLTNMALNRKDNDSVFIQAVALQLFKIGFVSSAVRDKCMKPSRILIANLVSKHPHLISDLLLALKKDFVLVGKFSLYLFKELPISLWKPNTVDTQTISNWMLGTSLTSWESNLARYILSQLNWATNLMETDLFLPREFHCHVAIVIVKALYTFAKESTLVGSTALISQGVRHVSSIVRNQTPEEALDNWAWQMLSRLKLHLMDQPVCVARLTLTDYKIAAQIPDINGDSENMCVLSDGISRNQSVAFYVALLTSNVGHNIPLICESCWDYCEILIHSYKYSQVLHILQLTLPYFLDSIDSLIKQEKFVRVFSKVVLADQTYMKMAKNLIVTDFPGTILRQTASLIQYHIDSFSRYCLPNPHPIIEMWIRILCSVWNDSCRSVAYLMDKVFSASLCDETAKQMIMKILSELIQSVSSIYRGANSSGLTSLVSWISYGSSADVTSVPVSLLPRNSTVVTESPYFAYFALQLEETFTQKETQLWSEVLKILATTTGKPNIDAAVKRACNALKINSMPSGWLAIYRWSLYALELPCDHPILPLFWQNFFKHYLCRVPGNRTTVCVGSKFFEGTVNNNYLKKIKKKLQECISHHTNRTFADDFEKPFHDSLTALYKSFTLWLEEPRLQEPELFLPALSAAFNIGKLSESLNGDEVMWIEYVDFDRMKVEQKKLNDEWHKSLFRDGHSGFSRAVHFVEDVNTLGNMIDRLKTYDNKLALPELTITPSIVPVISREKFLNKSQMLDTLLEYFRVLIQFSRSYETEKNELSSAAKSLLDAYRLMYNETDIEIKLYAACDTAFPAQKRRTVASIHCAGPALITLHVREGRLNKTVKHAAEKSEIDFHSLLKQTLKEPPIQLCVACIVIELAVETLSKEIIQVRQAADLTLLDLLHEVGVALFYKLISVYDTEVSSYFPTRILFKRIIDKLGLACIDNIESECSKLLKTILVSSHPKMSSILIPHLTPSAVTATAFVNLYSKVTGVISVKNVEFVLNVINKFCVKDWLHRKLPKLADRSRLIEIIANSLKEMSNQPLEPLLPIHKVLRNDICEILKYDFPEHYGEILFTVLKCSAEEKFSCDVWYDILNTLLVCTSKNVGSGTGTNIVLRPGMTPFQIRDVARKYAPELTNLTLQELMETCNLLGASFMKERLQYGLYGLYPKYRIYIEPIIMLHCIVGHAVIASVLYTYRTALADQICENVWPILLNLYSPWLVPYFTGSLQEPPEAWIQQLTDDRSILLPWTHLESDMIWAFRMMGSFIECLKFIMDTLPATSAILSNVMQLYITQYAHTSVKEHVLTVIQSNLTQLKWSRYTPTLPDMELMLKVVDQYLPMCHSFLGTVFVEIPWKSVIERDSSQNTTKVHVILLHLLIKLANEPHLRQTGNVTLLLQTAQQFHWHLVDATNYEHVLNWFVMSYDSRVLLQITDEDCTGIDMAAFELLRIAAGFNEGNSNQHPTTPRKRQMFIKACVKLCLQLANRYKSVFAGHQNQMEMALTRMLDQIESTIASTVTAENRILECVLLLSELMVLINQPSGSMLPKMMVRVLSKWITAKSAASCVMQSLLKILRSSVPDAVYLGNILETCLTAWFKNSAGMEECKWSKVFDVLHETSEPYFPIEDTLVIHNNVLSLYALSARQLEKDEDVFIYSKVIQCIINLKPTVDNESKLPILWSLAFKYGNRNWTDVMTSLLKLCSYFQQITAMKPGWGLLSVIGMQKQHVPTLRCKLLGYVLNTFIVIKLSEENSGKVETEQIKNDEVDKRTPLLAGAESAKSLSTLENLMNDKHYHEYRVTLEAAIRLIKLPNLTLQDGERFIITLAKQLYSDRYIHVFQFEDF